MKAVPVEQLNMFRPMSDPDYPACDTQHPHSGHLAWCTDQHIFQRCLAARNEKARRTIFAIPQIIAFFIFLIPWIDCYVLCTQGKTSCLEWRRFCEFQRYISPNGAIIMPVGLRGY